MLLNKRHSFLGRLVNHLAVIAFVLFGSVFTHGEVFTDHHESAAYHESGDVDESHHRHLDVPEDQCSQSHLIHCGASILALVASFDDCTARSCSVRQFRYISSAGSSDTSLDPPPPRILSRSI